MLLDNKICQWEINFFALNKFFSLPFWSKVFHTCTYEREKRCRQHENLCTQFFAFHVPLLCELLAAVLISFPSNEASNEGRITQKWWTQTKSQHTNQHRSMEKWDEQKERKTLRRLCCVFCVCFCLLIKLRCISSLFFAAADNVTSSVKLILSSPFFFFFLTTKNERRGMSRAELDFVQDEMQPDWMWKRNKNLFSPFFKLCTHSRAAAVVWAKNSSSSEHGFKQSK